MKSSITALKEAQAIIELAETIVTPSLHLALKTAVADTLDAVSKELRSRSSIEVEPETSSSSRGHTLYNQFMSQMAGAARKAMPLKSQKERLTTLASIWTRHKALGDLDEIMSAAHNDLAAFVPTGSTPVYAINI